MREKLLDSAAGLRLRFLTAIAAALLALVPASSAGAAVTIGQVADPSAVGDCAPGYDWLQLNVTSGSSYVVPGTGTIRGWTTHGGPDPGAQMTMKVFRKVPEPGRYGVVGHAGPEPVTAGGVTGNSFPANVPVKPGDVLGLHAELANYCLFVSGVDDRAAYAFGNPADGGSAVFTPYPGYRLNIQATFVPDNTFGLAGTQRNKKKGTATLTVNLPNPGELTASGKGVSAAGAAVISKAVTAGTATLLIKAKGKKKRKLNDTGKVKLNAAVTFTPTGGNPSTQSQKVKLKKKL